MINIMTIQKYSSLLTAALVSLSLVMSSTTMAQAQSNQRTYSPMADNLGSNINVILSDEVPFEEVGGGDGVFGGIFSHG